MLSLYSLRRGGGGGGGGALAAVARAEAAETLSMILPALYVSGRAAALNVAALTEHNIHYILNCSKTNLPVRTEVFHYKQLPLDDDVNQNIVQYFGEAFAFIDYAISIAQSAILVHCDVGVSRSCTIVLGFLMRFHRMPLPAAYELLERQRPVACPNTGFLRQLVEYALEHCPEAHQTTVLSPWLAHKFPRTDLYRIAQQLELQSLAGPATATATSTATSIATK